MLNNNKKEFLTFDRFELINTRGKKQSCQVCQKKFTVFVREHCCKRCFRSVCQECKAVVKVMVYQSKFEKKLNGICIKCKPQYEFINNYIQHYKLEFATQSQIGAKWAKRVKTEDKQIIKNQQSKREIIFSEQMFNELWESYNYSFREFIGILTFQKKQTDIYRMILNVLKLINRKIEIRLQNVIYLVIFVLCHCSLQSTAKIVIQLLYIQKIGTVNKQNILNYLKILKCQTQECKKLEQFIDFKLKKFINVFSFNIYTFQISLYVFQELVKNKSISELQRMFSVILASKKKFIIQNIKLKNQIDIYLLRNLQFKQSQLNYGILKTQDKKKIMNSMRTNSNFDKNQYRTSYSLVEDTLDNKSLSNQQLNKNLTRRQTSNFINDQNTMEFEQAIKKLKQEESRGIQQRDFKKKIPTFEPPNKILEQNKTSQQIQYRKSREGSGSSKIYLDPRISSSFSIEKKQNNLNKSFESEKSNSNKNKPIINNNLQEDSVQIKNSPQKLQTIETNTIKMNIIPQEFILTIESDKINKTDKTDKIDKIDKNSSIEKIQIKNVLKQENTQKIVKVTTENNNKYDEIKLNVQSYKIQIKSLKQKIKNLQSEKDNLQSRIQKYMITIKQLQQKQKSTEITCRNYQHQIQMLKIKVQNYQMEKKVKSSPVDNQEILQLKKQNQILTNAIKQKNNRIDVLLRQSKLQNYELDKQKAIISQYDNQKLNLLTKPKSNEQTKLMEDQITELKNSNEKLLKKIQELTVRIVQKEKIEMEQSRQIFQKQDNVDVKKQQCILF